MDATFSARLARFAQRLGDDWVLVGALVVAGLVVLWLASRLLRRRRGRSATAAPGPSIDVGALPQTGPPAGPPVLEFYNLPVRLAVVVLAPVGRLRDLPTPEELPDVLDALLPGLDQVALAHQPMVRMWPRQVSVRGFAHAFFNLARLPDDQGRRTPWSSVAGLFRVDDHPMMAGLILCADSPNRHGQYVMTHENQWLGILRIRLG